MMQYAASSSPPVTVTWNPSDKSSNITLSNADLTAIKTSGSSGSWDQVRATLGRSTGKFYFEVSCDDISSDHNSIVGICTAADSLAGFPGINANGYGLYKLTGDAYNSSTPTHILPGSTSSAVLAVAVDLSAGKIWFAINNTFSGSPSAGTGATYSGIAATTYLPAVGILNLNTLVDTGHFKLADLVYTPPTGFSPWE